MPDITLYFAPASRAFTPRWLLEELGVIYAVETIDLSRNEQKSAHFLTVNAMGKVPALRDGDVTVAENPAICLYLADRYGYGRLAPRIEDRTRGAYLRWMVFSTAVFEPAVYMPDDRDPASVRGRGWGDRTTALAALRKGLCPGPWLLGDVFCAADVMLGSLLAIALFNKRIPEPASALTEYADRLSARPAFVRAAAATWPT